MDLVHTFLNISLPLIALIGLPCLLVPYFIFKLINYIKKSLFPESVAGKVTLITGASSGIGQQLTYEYARKGARLALVARREDRLRSVADEARRFGSPDVIVIPADVSNESDCNRFINETINHFGQLDHLVNNAGILKLSKFEDVKQVAEFIPTMEINFWGSVYSTHFAIPHLRKSKGKIIVIASAGGWIPIRKMSFYCATKAAIISFYDVLRLELGSEIGITIVQPGIVDSEMARAFDGSDGQLQLKFIPTVSGERCANAIVRSACRGDKYLIEPWWMSIMFWVKMFCPELVEWIIGISLSYPEPPSFKKTA